MTGAMLNAGYGINNSPVGDPLIRARRVAIAKTGTACTLLLRRASWAMTVRDQPIIIRLALPPAAAVFTEVLTSAKNAAAG